MGKWNYASKGNIMVEDRILSSVIKVNRNGEDELILELALSEFDDLCDIIKIIRE